MLDLANKEFKATILNVQKNKEKFEENSLTNKSQWRGRNYEK